MAAYELFVRAGTNVPGKTQEDRLRASIDLLNRAVAIDPQFAAAYSAMANQHYFLGAYGDRSALARGVEAANSALKIDPELASGYRGLALNLNEMGRLREALPAYLKAVTLNPSYGAGLVDFAHGLATAGRYDESDRLRIAGTPAQSQRRAFGRMSQKLTEHGVGRKLLADGCAANSQPYIWLIILNRLGLLLPDHPFRQRELHPLP